MTGRLGPAAVGGVTVKTVEGTLMLGLILFWAVAFYAITFLALALAVVVAVGWHLLPYAERVARMVVPDELVGG